MKVISLLNYLFKDYQASTLSHLSSKCWKYNREQNWVWERNSCFHGTYSLTGAEGNKPNTEIIYVRKW